MSKSKVVKKAVNDVQAGKTTVVDLNKKEIETILEIPSLGECQLSRRFDFPRRKLAIYLCVCVANQIIEAIDSHGRCACALRI